MALSSIEPIISSASTNSPDSETASILAAIVITMYAGEVSRKAFRKLKRKAMISFFKDRVRSFVAPRAQISERTLLYILIAALVIVLIFVSWPVAIAVLLLGILLALLLK